jgi:hypothetical protein
MNFQHQEAFGSAKLVWLSPTLQSDFSPWNSEWSITIRDQNSLCTI